MFPFINISILKLSSESDDRFNRKTSFPVEKRRSTIIPPKALFARYTRFSKTQHLYALKSINNRTNAFANSFIPMTSNDWNNFSPTVFPAISFNLSRQASTNIFNSDPIHKSLLISKIQSTTNSRGCTFLRQLIIVSVSL